MENLDITKFSPEKAALAELATKYAGLTINGVDDTAGYAIVDEARKDLKKKRVLIKNTGKELRQEAVDFQKKVISMEKELIEIIEPLELELKAKQDAIDEEKAKALRMAALPARKEKLEKISFVMSDDEILAMTSEEFVEFYNVKHEEFLAEKERKIKEQEEKIARAKELAEAKEQARVAAEAAAKVEAERVAKEAAEREIRLKKEAEEAKEKAVKEAEEKAAAEKKALVDEQERKEKERLALEEKEKEDAKMKVEAEKKEQQRLERMKKYQKFLADCGFTEETKDEFYSVKTEAELILYKKVGSFKIN